MKTLLTRLALGVGAVVAIVVVVLLLPPVQTAIAKPQIEAALGTPIELASVWALPGSATVSGFAATVDGTMLKVPNARVEFDFGRLMTGGGLRLTKVEATDLSATLTAAAHAAPAAGQAASPTETPKMASLLGALDQLPIRDTAFSVSALVTLGDERWEIGLQGNPANKEGLKLMVRSATLPEPMAVTINLTFDRQNVVRGMQLKGNLQPVLGTTAVPIEWAAIVAQAAAGETVEFSAATDRGQFGEARFEFVPGQSTWKTTADLRLSGNAVTPEMLKALALERLLLQGPIVVNGDVATGEVRAEGRVVLEATGAVGFSQLAIDGQCRFRPETGHEVSIAIGGTRLALPPSDAPPPTLESLGLTDTDASGAVVRPFWHGYGGQVVVELRELDLGPGSVFRDVQLKISATPTELKVEPLSLQTAGGPMAAQVALGFDAANAATRYSVQGKVQSRGFNPGPFLPKDAQGVAALDGVLAIDAEFAARAPTRSELLDAATGSLRVSSPQGRMKGVPELAEQIVTVVSQLGVADPRVLGEVRDDFTVIDYRNLELQIDRPTPTELTLRRMTLDGRQLSLSMNGKLRPAAGQDLMAAPADLRITMGFRGPLGDAVRRTPLVAVGRVNAAGYLMFPEMPLTGTLASPQLDTQRLLQQQGTNLLRGLLGGE